MYVCEYRCYPRKQSTNFLCDYAGFVISFIVELIRNGQVVDIGVTAEQPDGSFVSCFTVPERGALDQAWYNENCRKAWGKLVHMSKHEPELAVLGESAEEQGSICRCKNCRAYVLYTYKTPVVCARCNKSIPLYNFPKTNACGDDYYSLLQWAKAYMACYRLFVDGIGERSGYMQMHVPNSALSQEGRRLCALLEELSGKPFYYFLFKYYADNKQQCPVCGKNWENKDKRFGYGFVCHTCRLVSDNEDGWW